MDPSEWALIIAPLALIQIGLAVYALYDIYKRGGARPPLPTWVWVLIVAFGQFWGRSSIFSLAAERTSSL